MTRDEKDRRMAAEIIERAQTLPPDSVAGVAGNDLAHSERLVLLVHKIAAESGVDVSHVRFKPLATDRLAGAVACPVLIDEQVRH